MTCSYLGLLKHILCFDYFRPAAVIRFQYLILVVLLLQSGLLNGQGLPSDSIPYKNNILPSPSFSYQPTTDIIIGAYLLYQFKPKKAGPETRASNAQFWIASSFNNQTFLELSHEFLSPGEKWYSKGKIDSRFNPEFYYGIGNDTPADSQAIAEYKYIQVEERLLRQIENKLFVGGQLKYIATSEIIFKTEQGDTIPPPNDVSGLNGVQYFGFGATGLIDQRNSILTPTGRKYIELALDYFLGDLSFLKIKFDYRKYWRLKDDKRKVVALQYMLDYGIGDVPFKEYSKLGGPKIMRGYILGRFRNLLSTQLQAEFRWTLIGRLGMTFFGGVGNVLPRLIELDPRDMKAALGTGLRFNINRKDPANVRIDFGFGLTDNSQALYITFGEAF